MREYPHGAAGEADVDSGPLIAGLSPSATVVAIGAALRNEDRSLADPLLHVTEAFGLPLTWRGTKGYGLGELPVGDAFLVWAKTATPWVARPTTTSLPSVVGTGWRLPCHALSLVLIALLWAPFWLRRRRPARPMARSQDIPPA